MVIDINKKTFWAIGVILCVFGVVKYDKIMLFLTTFRPPYFITGLTVYDENSQYYYTNSKIHTGIVLNKNAVFATVNSIFGKDVLYIHDGSNRFYNGLGYAISTSCPREKQRMKLGGIGEIEAFGSEWGGGYSPYEFPCTGKYCTRFKRIGEYAYFNERGEKVIIPAIIAVEDKTRTCESIEKGWESYIHALQRAHERPLSRRAAEKISPLLLGIPIPQPVTNKKKEERNN